MGEQLQTNQLMAWRMLLPWTLSLSGACSLTPPICPLPCSRHGELYSASIQHTRLPQSSAVSIASVTGKPTSYEDLEQCTGKCQAGTCIISAKEGCCKESSYGYYGYEDEYKDNDYYDSYGKGDYEKYGKVSFCSVMVVGQLL